MEEQMEELVYKAKNGDGTAFNELITNNIFFIPSTPFPFLLLYNNFLIKKRGKRYFCHIFLV